MNPQSANLYAYALNNPLRYVDPFGLRNAEGGNYCTMSVTPTPAPVPTPPPGTPRPGSRSTGGGDWLSGMVRSVRNAAGRASCDTALQGNPAMGAVCALLSPELAPVRGWYWDQIERSSAWFNNTCPGEVTRALVGGTVSGVGVMGALTPGFEWLFPLFPAGIQIAFGGPPGQPPFEHCW